MNGKKKHQVVNCHESTATLVASMYAYMAIFDQILLRDLLIQFLLKT